MFDNTRSPRTDAKVGAWFIGGRGSLATTATVGVGALARELIEPYGVTTANSEFTGAAFPAFTDIVVGGHDIVSTPMDKRADQLAAGGIFPTELVSAVSDDLQRTDEEVRLVPDDGPTQQHDIDTMAADILAFKERNGLRTVVVVDISSTEPLAKDHPAFHSEAELTKALSTPGAKVLPASSVAAAAAIKAGSPYACFTPSAGIALPVLRARADAAGIPYAGQDGKTGETLIRTVLAPMFAARGLKVLSWAGTNILGGGDGATLADPEAVKSKLASKNKGLHALAGDHVVTPLHIDNVPDMGNNKIAWDHVHAVGFLGSRVTLQTTWSAYDSSLAAPLVLDLVRSLALASDAGQSGVVRELGCFFKNPLDSDVHGFAEQTRQFADWVARTSAVVRASGDAVGESAADAEGPAPASEHLADASASSRR